MSITYELARNFKKKYPKTVAWRLKSHSKIIDMHLSDNEEISIPAIPEVRNFSYTIIDNKIYYRENSLMYLQDKPKNNLLKN